VILYSFALGSVWTFATIWTTGQFQLAYEHAMNHPEVYNYIVSSSVCGYFSITFVLLLIKQFGASVTEAVKSMRKVLTIVISFVIFSKPITVMHIVGFGFFIGSICYGYSLKSKSNTKASTKGGAAGAQRV
jgi:adenosine 3'-phospho 5'-phosphosulfate transporter B3